MDLSFSQDVLQYLGICNMECVMLAMADKSTFRLTPALLFHYENIHARMLTIICETMLPGYKAAYFHLLNESII